MIIFGMQQDPEINQFIQEVQKIAQIEKSINEKKEFLKQAKFFITELENCFKTIQLDLEETKIINFGFLQSFSNACRIADDYIVKNKEKLLKNTTEIELSKDLEELNTYNICLEKYNRFLRFQNIFHAYARLLIKY